MHGFTLLGLMEDAVADLVRVMGISEPTAARVLTYVSCECG